MSTDLPKVLVTYSDGTAKNAVTFVPKDNVTRESFTTLDQAIERYDPFQHVKRPHGKA